MSLSETSALLRHSLSAQLLAANVAEKAHIDCQGNRRATLEWAALQRQRGSLKLTQVSESSEWLLETDEHGNLPSIVPPSLHHELSLVWSQCTRFLDLSHLCVCALLNLSDRVCGLDFAGDEAWRCTAQLAAVLGVEWSADVLTQAHPAHLPEHVVSAHVEAMHCAGLIWPAELSPIAAIERSGGGAARFRLPGGALPTTAWRWASAGVRDVVYLSASTRRRMDMHNAVACHLNDRMVEATTKQRERRELLLLLLSHWALAGEAPSLLRLLAALCGWCCKMDL